MRGREKRDRYWVLKGRGGDFFVCASFGGKARTALCAFDSEEAAAEHLRGLTEPQMFLDTLERYGHLVPSCLRGGALLPRVREVSRRRLREAIEATGAGYVALNPPRPGARVETVELLLAEGFRADRGSTHVRSRRCTVTMRRPRGARTLVRRKESVVAS